MSRDLSKPILPIWKKKDEFDRWIFGLKPEDYEEVADRMACAVCLERWPMQMIVCPVCRERADQFGLIVEVPEDWKIAMAERDAEADVRRMERERREWAARRR